MAGNGTPKKEILDSVTEKIQLEKIDPLEKRIKALEDKCEYQHFQKQVEEITLKTIGSEDGRKRIKEQAKDAAKEYVLENGLQNRQFWIPVVVSIVSVGIAIAAIFIKK